MERLSRCRSCGSDVNATSIYCSECGSELALNTGAGNQCPNPDCGQVLDGQERFCPKCGTNIISVNQPQGAVDIYSISVRPELEQDLSLPDQHEKVSCEDCANYREARRISDQIVHGGGASVLQAMTKIKEDETKQQVAEAKQKAEQIKVQSVAWGFKPIMSDYCAAKAKDQIYEICEFKNREGNCSDYQGSNIGRAKTCMSCLHEVFVNPQKNFEVLKGISDPKIHHGMMEGIQADEANEITSLYYSKGESSGEPRFHSWCSRCSTGKYVALPYPNVHSDCLYHEPKEGYEPILLQTSSDQQDMSVQLEERKEAIAIQSRYMAANRAGTKEALVEYFRGQLERAKNGSLQEDIAKQFQDWAYITLQLFASTEEGKDVEARLAAYFPDEYHQIGSDGDRAKRLMRHVEQNNIFFELINESPYALLTPLVREVPMDKLTAICLQTIKEGFFLDNGLGETCKLRWVEEEEVRIGNGMYPEEMVGELYKTLKKLKLLASKGMEHVKKKGKEAEMITVMVSIAPLALPEVIEAAGRRAAVLGVPCPLVHEPLSEEQQRIILANMDWIREPEDLIVLLEGQLDTICSVWDNFWGSVQQEDMATDGYGTLRHLGSEIGELLIGPMILIVTYCNFLSRKINPLKHEDRTICRDYPGYTGTTEDLLQIMRKKTPDYASVISPGVKSLHYLQYEWRQEAAKNAPAESKAVDTPKSAQASTRSLTDLEKVKLMLNHELQPMVEDINDAIELGDTLDLGVLEVQLRGRLSEYENIDELLGIELDGIDTIDLGELLQLLKSNGIVS